MEGIKLILTQTSWIEYVGFITSIIYVLLASKLFKICWLFAIISSVSYSILSFQFTLYLESFLQLFYVLLAIVSWIYWHKKDSLEINTYSFRKHLIFFIPLILLSLILGYIFSNFTNQFYPYIDACIFVYSLFSTYLLSKKNIENWIYFIIIDIFASYLYFKRELYLTSLLYIIYTILAVYGYWNWQKIKRSIYRS